MLLQRFHVRVCDSTVVSLKGYVAACCDYDCLLFGPTPSVRHTISLEKWHDVVLLRHWNPWCGEWWCHPAKVHLSSWIFPYFSFFFEISRISVISLAQVFCVIVWQKRERTRNKHETRKNKEQTWNKKEELRIEKEQRTTMNQETTEKKEEQPANIEFHRVGCLLNETKLRSSWRRYGGEAEVRVRGPGWLKKGPVYWPSHELIPALLRWRGPEDHVTTFHHAVFKDCWGYWLQG